MKNHSKEHQVGRWRQSADTPFVNSLLPVLWISRLALPLQPASAWCGRVQTPGVLYRRKMRKIEDFKPFVPSNDYEVSKAFYQCIGFTVNWDSDEVCEIDTNFGYRFLLLPRNHNNYAQSLMLHFMVNSAQEWHDHFTKIDLMEKFKGTKVAAPELMPWGLLITHVWDPAGVLLHFAERPDENT